MLMQAIATRLLNRHVSRKLVRVIPHPVLRAAATLAVSVIVPIVVERVIKRGKTLKESNSATRPRFALRRALRLG